MLKRKSVALTIQGSVMVALFVFTFIGARESWLLMTMELLFAVICFTKAVQERRFEIEVDRRRAARRSKSNDLS
ncbi:hypothetical protein [Kocuria rhizophila]|uniref:hypothetical protein n=1 Tax=Kocuria rhizophila TaxID=72000 RepID=UPI003D6DD020